MGTGKGSRQRPFWLVAYYGPGGRKGGKGREGEREGDLCIAVEYTTAYGRSVEEDILEKREDIGVVQTGQWPGGETR